MTELHWKKENTQEYIIKQQQKEDYHNLVSLMQTARETIKEERKPIVDKFYKEVLRYSKKYHTNFDPLNEPQ